MLPVVAPVVAPVAVPVAGLLLAAGAGSRMGTPKALVRGADGGSWLVRSLAALGEGGCDPVSVVLGAESGRATTLVPDGVEVVLADDWAVGMGASLRAGLLRLGADSDIGSVVVSLVDLPDVGPEVVARLVAHAGTQRADGSTTAVLARASYGGVPGHPVLLGRDHWSGVALLARGDLGAKPYLAGRTVDLVECGDLATGRDQDTPRPPGHPVAEA